MKIFTSLFILFATSLAFAQPTCQLNHKHFHELDLKKFRSGDESKRSDTVNVQHYSVYLDLTQGTSNLLSASCKVKFEALMDISTISLDLLEYTVDSIIYQGNPITFNYNDTLIVADLGSTLNSGSVDSVTVYYQGTPQLDPSGWGGVYMQTSYFYNLGVGFESDPHNFGRAWHPCFDNFVERATYDYQVLTADNYTAYCNGTRTNVQSVGIDSLLTSWEMNMAIPSYLASFAVAEYVHVSDPYFSSLQSLTIPVWLAARESDTTNLKSSFLNLHNALQAYENSYGPYVWERVGYVLVPFSSGAMEHATNIAYPQLTANGSLTYETLMAHELSHHWWGDWVTCETAEEMWINEGMAVYSEHLFLEQVYDWDAYMAAVRANHYDVLHKAHFIDSGHYALNAVPIKYTYGEHSYRKGADVMHTLRSYLGDSIFFAGLQAIQTNYGGGTISSFEFRDEMNTISGANTTDFFNDWIFQPGFSQFSITEMTATQNGPNYDVIIVVDQKLKGAATYHNNVPLTVTLKDAAWNEFNTTISMSGDYETFSFSVPFEPAFIALNTDEKINDAVTAEQMTLSTNGVKMMDYANLRLSISNLTDSAFIRVEHNWVYADVTPNLTNTVLSKDRYWNIHGLDLDNITATMRFEFNGQQSSAGDLDNSILLATGNQAFHEDSVVLYYRPNALANWEEHPDYSVNTVGSATDKKGWCETNIFMPGQYCFGYRVESVDIDQNESNELTYSIYPNPGDDTIFIDLENWNNAAFQVEIFAINGQFIQSDKIQGGQVNSIDVQNLEAGAYLIVISNEKNEKIGSKRLLIK